MRGEDNTCVLLIVNAKGYNFSTRVRMQLCAHLGSCLLPRFTTPIPAHAGTREAHGWQL